VIRSINKTPRKVYSGYIHYVSMFLTYNTTTLARI